MTSFTGHSDSCNMVPETAGTFCTRPISNSSLGFTYLFNHRHTNNFIMEEIEQELARIGVTWPRDLFLICRTNRQSPKTIAHHVAEMWFLYTHVNYHSPYNSRVPDWPTDMLYSRPCFVFDEWRYQVDNAGRQNALKSWVYHYRPNPEDAVDFPELPTTMQQDVLHHAKHYQFEQWVRANWRQAEADDCDILSRAYADTYTTQHLMPRQDAFAFFDKSFGVPVLKSMLVRQMNKKLEFLCTKYLRIHKVQKLRVKTLVIQAATKILKESSCMPVYMATKLVAIANVMHHDFRKLLKPPTTTIPPQQHKSRKFSDVIKDMDDHDVTAERVRLFEMGTKHGAFVYCCDEQGCKYTGDSMLALVSHATKKHDIDSIRQINGTQSTDTLEARFRHLVKMRHVITNNAACTIQRSWHRAISCPDYTLCKNRLQKEFSELL